MFIVTLEAFGDTQEDHIDDKEKTGYDYSLRFLGLAITYQEQEKMQSCFGCREMGHHKHPKRIYHFNKH